MLKALIFIALIFQTSHVFSQNRLTGNILSSHDFPIEYASVIIKDHNDKILNYTFTDVKGNFQVVINTSTDIKIEVNKLGFVKYVNTIKLNPLKQDDKIEIKLEDDSTILDDVIIEINNPIQVRGDTLEYDAKAFSTGREVVVEDLLKNIPGIVIEKDGTIKYEDRKIEKVMVDGDDFFNRGYSLLTKNMPSKPLAKVQLLTRYSNNKLLKGIEQSDKVAINLTISDEYKDMWFGDISLGYGLASENRYDVSGNLMNFSTKYKNFLSLGLNNIGIDRIGNLDDMFFNNTEIESIGLTAQVRNVMNLSNGRAGELKDHRTRINNAEHITLSSIVPVGNRIKLKLVGFLGFDENYSFNSKSSVVDVSGQSFENKEQNNFISNLKKGYINLLGTYDVSKTQLLQISSVWNQGNTENKNDLIFNGISTQENLETNNKFIDQKITYTHQWNNKNVILFKSRYFSNKIPQLYNIDDYLMGDLFSENATAVNNNIKNEKTFLGIEMDVKLKQKKGNLIDFQVGYLFHDQSLNTSFNLVTEKGKMFPEGFQTTSSFQLGDLYAKSGYVWIKDDFKITTRIDVHQLFNKFSTLNSSKQKDPFYINPSISINWDLNTTSSLAGSYLVNFQNTSLTEVNDTYLLTSSRSFNKGLGEFSLTDFQMGNLTYAIRHYLNRYRLAFTINYRKQHKMLSSRSLIEQNSSLSEMILMKGRENYGANFSSNFSLKAIKSNVSLDAAYSHSSSFNEINGSGLRKNDFFSQNYKISWRSTFKSIFNYHIGSEWTLSKVHSPDFENDYTNGFSYLDLYFNFTEKFDTKIISEHYYFGSLPQNQRNHIFVDMEMSYKIKGDKFTFGIRGNNLLNKQNFTSFYVNDIGYSSTSYRLMSRYVMGSIKLRF